LKGLTGPKIDGALAVRRRLLNLFMRECACSPTSCIPDFGVSGHRDHVLHQTDALLMIVTTWSPFWRANGDARPNPLVRVRSTRG